MTNFLYDCDVKIFRSSDFFFRILYEMRQYIKPILYIYNLSIYVRVYWLTDSILDFDGTQGEYVMMLKPPCFIYIKITENVIKGLLRYIFNILRTFHYGCGLKLFLITYSQLQLINNYTKH